MSESRSITEQEWLGCEEPRPMLHFLRYHRPRGRKLQLIAVACCRNIWRLFGDPRNRHAVEVAERFADGESASSELVAANLASYQVNEGHSSPGFGFVKASPLSKPAWEAAQAATVSAIAYADDSSAGYNASVVAEQAVDAVAEEAREQHAVQSVVDYAARVAEANERATQVALIRCVTGNPFREVASGATFVDSEILAIARAAHEDRRLPSGHLEPNRLAVLSDALEESGCTDPTLLSHLPSPGPHVRGCWALDLILGKG